MSKSIRNERIYDYFYNKVREFNKQLYVNNNLYDEITMTDEKKTEVITEILDSLPFDESDAIQICVHHSNFMNKSIWGGRDKKKVIKQFETATKHMYSPINIAKAVPDFYISPEKLFEKYDVPSYNSFDTEKILTKEDFGNKQYIITALNKSGIYTQYQLLKHLSLGWYYLWTIPGCGDGARQQILMAVDRWNKKPKIQIDRLW